MRRLLVAIPLSAALDTVQRLRIDDSGIHVRLSGALQRCADPIDDGDRHRQLRLVIGETA